MVASEVSEASPLGEENNHETGWALLWFRESTPGSRIGSVEGVTTNVGSEDKIEDGNALEDMYIAAVRYLSLASIELKKSYPVMDKPCEGRGH
jgi:hypothetical protein